MKKLLTLMISLILCLSLAACGEEEITLQNKIVNGITLNVPSDFGKFEDYDEQIKLAKNEDNTSSISISERVDAHGIIADSWDEQAFLENILSGFGDAKILEFSNAKTVAGVPTVFAHYVGKNSSDVEVEGYSYFLYHDDGTYQPIAFSFTKGADTSLTKNLTAIVDSIK